MPLFDTAKYGTVARDVTYCEIDGLAQQMDIYYPSAGGPWPCAVFVHGGGWSEGDKAPLPVVPAWDGLLVVSINYRMYPAYRFPAMIEDVTCAVRHLRASAGQYNLDPDRIALIGHSAGAHLVALAGLAAGHPDWDSDPYGDQSSRVAAVVAMSGPSDLTGSFPDWVEELIGNVFGERQLAGASPLSYVRQDAPPFLIIHGECDEVIPAAQAHLLHDALREAGAASQLVMVKNAGHGFEPAADGPVSPAVDDVFKILFDFLARALRI